MRRAQISPGINNAWPVTATGGLQEREHKEGPKAALSLVPRVVFEFHGMLLVAGAVHLFTGFRSGLLVCLTASFNDSAAFAAAVPLGSVLCTHISVPCLLGVRRIAPGPSWLDAGSKRQQV